MSTSARSGYDGDGRRTAGDELSYAGYVRVIGENGNILDVAEASLGPIERPGHRWGGTLAVWSGGALDGKTIPVELEVPGSFRAPALLVPGRVVDRRRHMSVLGDGPSPFDP